MEIGHVLFLDVVGYSKLLLDEQRELQQQLNQIVRETEQVRAAEAVGKLIQLPAGDGMALVFFNSPETPVRCAIEIAKECPTLEFGGAGPSARALLRLATTRDVAERTRLLQFYIQLAGRQALDKVGSRSRRRPPFVSRRVLDEDMAASRYYWLAFLVEEIFVERVYDVVNRRVVRPVADALPPD